MKAIAFILSLFIFTLAVIPCTDGMTCEDIVQSEQHDHSEDTNDLCTPFCTCACCGLLITGPQDGRYTFGNILCITLTSNYYIPLYSEEFLMGVWHPPTLS